MVKDFSKDGACPVSTMKQTEIGLLPENWEVVELSELSSKIASGKSNTANNINGIYPIYGSTGIIGIKNYYDYEGEKITIARVGANAGYISIIKGKYCISDNTLFVQCNDRIILSFLYKYLQSINLNKYVFGSGQPLITGTILKNLQIPLPPLPEQEAIAEALSDADAWIESLEQLIAKKRLIKQGAMQELLTPKEDWEVKKLGEVIEKCTTGKLDANAMVENGEYRFYTCAKNYSFIDNYAFDDEALLVSGNGANVGYIHYYKGKFNAYQRTYVLLGFKINTFFLKVILDRNLKERISTEVSAGNTPYIKMDTITDMKISFPKSLTEQTRIATILSDMDAELEALEGQLGKARKVKQGMMQELLTGRVRLV